MSERAYPDYEIEGSVKSSGGWTGWIGDNPGAVVLALRWKADQGDQLPDELEGLRDAIAQFGLAPLEQAVARVIGLEAAFAEIAGLMGRAGDVQRIQAIVRTCVRFSGEFGPADGDETIRRIIDAAFEGSRVEVDVTQDEEDPERVH